MPNDLAPAAAPAVDEASIRRNIEQENRLSRLEQENMRLGMALNQRQAPPPPPVADPFDKLETDISLPKEAREALDRGSRMRAQQEAGRIASMQDQKFIKMQQDSEYRIASQMALSQNPDIAADMEGAAAAAGMVDFEITQSGRPLDPVSYVNRVVQKYRQHHPKPAPAPPHVEGSGAPNVQRALGSPEPEAAGPNSYEEDYGFEPGEIQDLRQGGKTGMKNLTERYANEKNLSLQKEGYVTNLVEVAGPMKAYKKQQAAAAK